MKSKSDSLNNFLESLDCEPCKKTTIRRGEFRVNPFVRYNIYLEEILTPQKKYVIIEDLKNRGLIHTNARYGKNKFDNKSFLQVYCTPMHLGKVVDIIMQFETWCIVERDNKQT